MYNPADTIVAVSSPSSDHRAILRVAGPQVIDLLNQVFSPAVSHNPGIIKGIIKVNLDINLDAVVYLFRRPHSYTGDDLAEIHLWANPAVTEVLLEHLLMLGTRPAAPGEFTARAYLNGKIDLAQAEAVNEVITASNAFQLAAAENLLAGRLAETTTRLRSAMLDILSQVEARLDFSTEDITPTSQDAVSLQLAEIEGQLKGLLSDTIRSESTIELPAVGIAGAPNAGKSTLLNTLLGKPRSIVSHERKTTRDVLTGELMIGEWNCILFDCAGLTTHADTILDELAQQAAIEAIRNAMVVLFCVDIAKPIWTEDLAVLDLITTKDLIPVATKTDLLNEENIAERLSRLKSLFGCDFLPISAHSGFGIDEFKIQITDRIITPAASEGKYGIALTARHRQAVIAAIADIEKAVDELKAGNEEVAAMLLRTAHNQLSDIEQHNIDEQLLDRIFSRFCIGK